MKPSARFILLNNRPATEKIKKFMLRFYNFLFAFSFLTLSSWAASEETLPGTARLTEDQDLADKMMDGAHRFVERKIAESITTRPNHWHRDFSSITAYEKSVEPNRERLKFILGVVDQREASGMEYFGDDDNPSLVTETERYRVHQAHWPVLEGVGGEGLLVQPKTPPVGYVIAIPDADQMPEQLVGLKPGIAPEAQFARRLAENGFFVIIPTLIDRSNHPSPPGYPKVDESNREWIYRQAYHMGRHIIGYEAQKVMSLVDWLKKKFGDGIKIGVAGYGEGGLIAFDAAAVDPRIDAAFVSGYFDARQEIWAEPIERNVWSFLREFGDAEIASLIAPRSLIIEYSAVPDVKNRKGDLRTPDFQRVQTEFARIDTLLKPGFQTRHLFHGDGGSLLHPGSVQALSAFAHALGVETTMAMSDEIPIDRRKTFDPSQRQKRQVKELEDHVQGLVLRSEEVRNRFFLYKIMPQFAVKKWSTERRHETYSPEPFIEGTKEYRQYFWEESMGKFEEPMLPFNPRTRKIYDTEKWVGYDVVLDVWPELYAWGILLVPKNIRPGEQRPVVVCQHGRQGLPKITIESDDSGYYGLAAQLADRGFVTFSPHNLYRGEDRYRWLTRKANGVKATLFSFITAQHDQILRWLPTLPFVDGKRIAFYGKSYGGETAMRVPAILEKYCLSICAGDFNQWTRKVAATDQDFSFMYTIEWEMPYFNLGNTFDYTEMAYLLFPRPFMVERGHHDLVGRDSWVAYEYAKVRWLYTQFAIPDKTEIEFFNGGHAINGEGTFKFLHKYLNLPEPQ